MSAWKRLSRFASLGPCIGKLEMWSRNSSRKMGIIFVILDCQSTGLTVVTVSVIYSIALPTYLTIPATRQLVSWNLVMSSPFSQWSTLECIRISHGLIIGPLSLQTDRDLRSLSIPCLSLKMAVRYWRRDWKHHRSWSFCEICMCDRLLLSQF